MLGKNLIQAAAGNAGAAGGLGIEEVFSTWLYTGNGGTQTITNGIDLSGEGGLVWTKGRNTAYRHGLIDTERGGNKILTTIDTRAQETSSTAITSFNSDGYSVGPDTYTSAAGTNYASWTFRKAPGFFDVVTWTGNYPTEHPRDIAHSLGSTPGCVIIKRTSTTGYWGVWHRSISTGDYTANQTLILNSTAAAVNYSNVAGPFTSTTIRVGEDFNQAGETYVAYLFAHDEAIFGESGDQSVVKCGTFTINGSGFVPATDLGWEPQWVLVKRTDSSGQWYIYDNMRGITTGGKDSILYPNLSNAEDSSANTLDLTSTGFTGGADGFFSGSGSTYIYIAIRRGPMKTPTSGTEVFKADIGDSSGSATVPEFTAGFPVDLYFLRPRSAGQPYFWVDRPRGEAVHLNSASTATEANWGDVGGLDNMTGCYMGALNNNYISWMFRRAPGFFDVVAYTGDNTFRRAITHNLAASPELVIIKCRSQATDWIVWHSGADTTQPSRKTLLLNSSAAATIENYFFDGGIGIISSTQFGGFGAYTEINASSRTYIAYLFATLPGISKVGSYTGTATTQQINCGFTSGARFVLIKRTDSTGDWYVWDTARGIVSGNDPYLLLNSTAAEVTSTDYIDPYSAGFEISSTAPAAINASGGSFIFLAIA